MNASKYSIYKDERGRRVNLSSKDRDRRVNGDKVVILLNIKAKLGEMFMDFISMEGKDRDIFQKDLEKQFDLKRSSISLMLNNMEKNKLIERVAVSEDARLKKIVLTEKAIKLNEKISCAIDLIENKLAEDLTMEEVEIFYKVLNKMRKSLE